MAKSSKTLGEPEWVDSVHRAPIVSVFAVRNRELPGTWFQRIRLHLLIRRCPQNSLSAVGPPPDRSLAKVRLGRS